MNVSDPMHFETGMILPFRQTLKYDNQEAFKLSVKDNCQAKSDTDQGNELRGNFQIQASLSKPFETKGKSSVLRNTKLIYVKGDKNVLLNGTGGEILSSKQDKKQPDKKDFEFVVDDGTKKEGFKLEVPPGEATAKETYFGEITFDFVQGP